MKDSAPHTSRKFKFMSAILAFLLWGGWACYVNRGSATGGILAGLVQGIASFTITLILVHSVTWLFRHIRGHVRQVLVPPTITVACTGSLLAMIHHLAGTPAIFTTIVPPLSIAFVFCLFTTVKLLRLQKSQQEGRA